MLNTSNLQIIAYMLRRYMMDSFTLSVKLEEVNRIPKILSTQLDMCRDSQFYIHKMLYNYIRTNNYRHDFWEYEGYEFYNNSMGISRIGFTTGFKGFVHLTQFELWKNPEFLFLRNTNFLFGNSGIEKLMHNHIM